MRPYRPKQSASNSQTRSHTKLHRAWTCQFLSTLNWKHNSSNLITSHAHTDLVYDGYHGTEIKVCIHYNCTQWHGTSFERNSKLLSDYTTMIEILRWRFKLLEFFFSLGQNMYTWHFLPSVCSEDTINLPPAETERSLDKNWPSNDN